MVLYLGRAEPFVRERIRWCGPGNGTWPWGRGRGGLGHDKAIGPYRLLLVDERRAGAIDDANGELGRMIARINGLPESP